MDSLFPQILDLMNLGIIVTDQDLNIVVWNSWLEEFTHKSKHTVIGQNLFLICPLLNDKIYREIIHKALAAGQSRFCSGALHKFFIMPENETPNDLIRQNMQVEPFYTKNQKFAVIQITDVTSHLNRVFQLRNIIKKLELENQQIKDSHKISRHQSLHDPLTGLANRLLFKERLHNALTFAETERAMLAVMFMDLDGFKEINDNYSHAVGDYLLHAVAKRLQSCIRKSDTLARLGGDEFALLLPQIKSKQDAAHVAQKVIKAFTEPYIVSDTRLAITISVGISFYPFDSTKEQELIYKADNAMYISKRNGKNKFRFYRADD